MFLVGIFIIIAIIFIVIVLIYLKTNKSKNDKKSITQNRPGTHNKISQKVERKALFPESYSARYQHYKDNFDEEKDYAPSHGTRKSYSITYSSGYLNNESSGVNSNKKKESIACNTPKSEPQTNFVSNDSPYSSSPGKDFENKIVRILKRLPGCDYLILQNLYVPALLDDTTSEIDIVLIHPKGIFVFECKDYGGVIQCGNPENVFWDVSYPSGRNTKLYSPVIQNRGHISILENYLRQTNCCSSLRNSSNSWIVFGKNAVLRIPHTSSDYTITQENELYDKITASFIGMADKYSKEKIEKIYDTLYPLTQVSDEVKQKHIKDIENHRIFTGSSAGLSNEYPIPDIDEATMNELIEIRRRNGYHYSGNSERKSSSNPKPKQGSRYQKKTETQMQYKPERHSEVRPGQEPKERIVLRKTPENSNFFPKCLTAEDSGNPEITRKNQLFYDWVVKLDHNKLPLFCKILLEGNGFTSIRMPKNEDNFMAAFGGGESYLIKISNKKKKVDGYFIDSIQHKIPVTSKDIIVIITSWEFVPEALNAAKKYRIIPWDRETLSILKHNLESNASEDTKSALKKFMKDNKWNG